MPRRQKPTLADFLSNCARNNLNGRDTNKIVGHQDWVNAKNSELFGNGFKYTTRPSPTRNTLKKKQGYSEDQIAYNRKSIDNIINFTLDNNWQQIDGGEFDNRYVNSQVYPDKMFNYGKIVEYSTNELHYFPVSNKEDDPEGIAFHYGVNSGGQYYTIHTNNWTNMEDTRRGRREEKRQMKIDDRLATRYEYEEENKRINLQKKAGNTTY
jgi:hypothetical protein